MSVTENTGIINDVLYEWVRLKHSPYKVAKAVGVSARDVLKIVADHGHRVSEIIQRHDGWGRPEMRQYLVSRKKAADPWDNDDPDIACVRKEYEAGKVELATGRDGAWLILYAIPRKKITPRPGYFLPEPSI